MKKLMIAAAAALCATVGMSEGVSSQNIVGYQMIDLVKGWSFFTATFKDTASVSLDIQKISSVQSDGSAWKTGGSSNTKCAGNIVIQKVDTEGSYLDEYRYFSTKTPQGWYNSSGTSFISSNTVFLANGEGIVVNNTHPVGAKLVVGGEVTLTPSRLLPKGWSFCGNFTPVAIDLQDISSVQSDGTAWKTGGSSNTKCAGNIVIQKVDTEGNYGTEYRYYSTKTPQGWYDSTGSSYIAKELVTFAPGEGFVVNNTHPVGAQLVLPAPVSAE